MFANGLDGVKSTYNLVAEAGQLAQGIGTVALVNCQEDDGKKLCKKLKISPKPFILKHYHNGEYHKDYDRMLLAKSMHKFLKDPKGDIPWDEDPSALDVIHLDNKPALRKLVALGKPTLVMFYAPWCGHCKRLKPEFSALATELKGKVMMGGMDLTQEGNDEVARIYKIEGYPTLEYFDGGKHKFRYSGENSKDSISKWLKNPTSKPEVVEKKEEEIPWSQVPSEIVHLTDATFTSFISTKKSVLVMFYAPWCGYCKKTKPLYMAAAKRLKDDGVDGILAAVDATAETETAGKHEIEGFPTFLYFKNGKFAWKVEERTEDGFYNFMKNPVEPPPTELPWKEQPGNVVHLTTETFKTELKKKKTSLVMFYAPWCGHCKRVKPIFSEAAGKIADDDRIMFAAVDCTTETTLCTEHEVKGYPTLIHFSYGKHPKQYNNGYDVDSFLNFVHNAGKKTEL